jgi:hypothetical protein
MAFDSWREPQENPTAANAIRSACSNFFRMTSSLMETRPEPSLSLRWDSSARVVRCAESEMVETDMEITRRGLEGTLRGRGTVTASALNRAANWLEGMHETAKSAGLRWIDPQVAVSPENDIVFEWWTDCRKLTAYFGSDDALLLRVWGPNIHTEMEETQAEDATAAVSAWSWLVS